MKVATELYDETLDRLTDDEDDEASSLVYVIIGSSDGMRYTGAVSLIGADLTPEQYAEALVSAVHGAARTHSVALADAVDKWLVEPPDMELMQGDGTAP